jgi:hypothetical protein
MRSTSPASQNLVVISTDGVIAFPRFCHARHSRQVSTIGLIKASLTSSIPAACRMVRIFGSLACHHRKCSLRSSLFTTLGSYERRFLKLTCILNRVQSGSLGAPEPVSVQVRVVLCSLSEPLPFLARLAGSSCGPSLAPLGFVSPCAGVTFPRSPPGTFSSCVAS